MKALPAWTTRSCWSPRGPCGCAAGVADDFAGGYRPLDLGEDLIGFQRGADVLSIVRRLPRSPADRQVRLPPGRWVDAFTGATHEGSSAELFASLPVALLVREP